MADEKRTNKTITLGSGDLMVKEYDGTIPAYTDFDPETDILGYIQGGCTLEYKGTWYDAKDDSGKAIKAIVTDEECILKSGVVTWNGETLEKLSSTARVTEDGGIRTVKIGGVGNHNGKSYAICFHHSDKADGDVWLLVRGVNQAGFSIAFAKDKETVIDAEFKCLPQDDDGTLVQYLEETAKTV